MSHTTEGKTSGDIARLLSCPIQEVARAIDSADVKPIITVARVRLFDDAGVHQIMHEVRRRRLARREREGAL